MTISDRNILVGVFENRPQAQKAVEELRRAGFADDQIGFAGRHGADLTADLPATEDSDTDPTPTVDNAVAGAIGGSVVGGLLGAAAALLIPGVGPVLAGGILASTLGGMTVGAAAGGLLGALTDLGVPEEEARRYQDEFEAGRTLVTVQTDGRFEAALDILQRHGGFSSGQHTAAANSPGATPSAGTTATPGIYGSSLGTVTGTMGTNARPNFDEPGGRYYRG